MCLLVPILVAAAAVRIEDAARLLLVHVVQHSVGRGALKNAPVTLESMRIEPRAWRIELRGLRIGNVPPGLTLTLALTHIGNVPGQWIAPGPNPNANPNPNPSQVPGEWDAPHAVTLERLRLSVGGLVGLLSLLQVPQANKAGAPGGLLRLGSLEFTVGFCIKVSITLDPNPEPGPQDPDPEPEPKPKPKPKPTPKPKPKPEYITKPKTTALRAAAAAVVAADAPVVAINYKG